MIHAERAIDALGIPINAMENLLAKPDISTKDRITAEIQLKIYNAAHLILINIPDAVLDLEEVITIAQNLGERAWESYLRQNPDQKLKAALEFVDAATTSTFVDKLDTFLSKWKERHQRFQQRDAKTTYAQVLNSFVSHSRQADCQRIDGKNLVLFEIGNATLQDGRPISYSADVLVILQQLESSIGHGDLMQLLSDARDLTDDSDNPAARGRKSLAIDTFPLHLVVVPSPTSPDHYRICLGFNSHQLEQMSQHTDVKDDDRYVFAS